MVAIAFVLRLTRIHNLDFQSAIVPHNFHVSVALFKTVRECRSTTMTGVGVSFLIQLRNSIYENQRVPDLLQVFDNGPCPIIQLR